MRYDRSFFYNRYRRIYTWTTVSINPSFMYCLTITHYSIIHNEFSLLTLNLNSRSNSWGYFTCTDRLRSVSLIPLTILIVPVVFFVNSSVKVLHDWYGNSYVVIGAVDPILVLTFRSQTPGPVSWLHTWILYNGSLPPLSVFFNEMISPIFF